jgi:hypothetical protein
MRELYDELAKYEPEEWGPTSSLAAYADRFREDFEATFSEVVLKIPKNDTGPRLTIDTLTLLEKQRPLARYFSRFHLDSSNKDYFSLLLTALKDADRISNSLFASINYDCLLEQAAHRLGFRVDYLCTENIAVRVAKLHGSCNFITKRLSANDRAMLAAPSVRYEIPIDFLSPMDIEKTLVSKLTNPAYIPVMSQVSPGKEQHVSPHKIQEMRNSWSQALSGAKRLAIIGVSHNPNDTHIIAPIRNTQAEILYIGDKENFGKWQAENKNFRHTGNSLEEGFERLIKALGLA